MQCTVRQEAGRAFAPLAERLTVIAAETAPLVEAVTRLPLPDPVIIRTVTARRWLKDHWRSARRRYLTEAATLPGVTTSLNRAAGARLLSARKARRALWPTIGGQAVQFKPGRPEMVVLPQALQHAARLDDTPFLYRIVAHELTHLAQYAASMGAVWEAQDTFFPSLRGIADRDYGFLLEGHAVWADQLITAQIFGAPVPTTAGISPGASTTFRKVSASAQSKTFQGGYGPAARAVTDLIDTAGLDAFNQVWTRPDLVPTCTETDTPQLWQRRFAPLATQPAPAAP